MDTKQIVKVSPISGFPEHLPRQRRIELRLLDIIRKQYELHGFISIETPAVERLSVLKAKEKESEKEGDVVKQIYTLGKPQVEMENEAAQTDTIPKLGLHFDLTVPLARYVAQHSNDLVFPFRRYQIQKVWRGEKAQRGRSREFYQCDIDIVGRNTLDIRYDAEILAIISEVFSALGIAKHLIRVSNRKVLSDVGAHFKLTTDQIKAIRKILDRNTNLDVEIENYFNDIKTALTVENLKFLPVIRKLLFAENITEIEKTLNLYGIESNGFTELKTVVESAKKLGCPAERLVVDLKIARGLDYYTGTVYEIFLPNEDSSICSGGRFDNLASYFSDVPYPGVGISIGLTRIMDLLGSRGLLNEEQAATPTFVLVTTRSENENLYNQSLSITKAIRQEGVPAEVFLESKPVKEQIDYAVKLGIPYVVLASESDFGEGMVRIKNMNTVSATSEVHMEVRKLAKYFATELNRENDRD